MKLEDKLRDQWKRLNLVEVVLKESVNGQQAICKYQSAITGPWGVGCDPDPAAALDKALDAGEALMAEEPKRNSEYKEWTPDLAKPKNQQMVETTTKQLDELF